MHSIKQVINHQQVLLNLSNPPEWQKILCLSMSLNYNRNQVTSIQQIIIIKIIIILPTVLTALLQSSTEQECKTISTQFLNYMYSVLWWVSNASGCVIDVNCLLLRNDGVGLLTTGGGSLGGVGCCGDGGAHSPTLCGGLLSHGCISLGVCDS